MFKNGKYKETKKNGGVIPAVPDIRVLYVPIKCGHCLECRKAKQREWQARLGEDIKTHTNGKFVTLTFSTESLKKLVTYIRDHADDPFNIEKGYDLDNKIAITAVHLFRGRWRKQYKKEPRHWLITELGGNNYEHMHLHGIIWTDQTLDDIEKHWQYGFIYKGPVRNGKIINYVNQETVSYCIKYVSKMDLIHKYYEPRILCSKGIGNNYTNTSNAKNNRYNGNNTKETYRTNTGHEIPLPIYWRNKIYTDHEKEQLWLNKLNKQKRYVLGQEIDISESEKDYFAALETAQKHSTKLGYRGNKIQWSRQQYEIERRVLIQQTRLINNK